MNDQHKTSTIMYTVIDGYTTLVSENKQKALSLLEKTRSIVKPLIKHYMGDWHKDSLSSFPIALDAVNCAVQIQRKLNNETDIKLRIGIHVSDALFGAADGVKVATGIGEIAEPGSVCISEQVYYAVRDKLDSKADFLGEKILENVNRTVKVYTLHTGGTSESKMELSHKKSKPSIAVLPFINMSADPEQEYFCDGIAETIIDALSHVEDLRVIARTSSFYFKGEKFDVKEIGEKLNVETIMEGSVQKAGNRIRITAQLIKVDDLSHLWSEKFDRELEDIFAIQDEISLAIVDVLRIKLLNKEKEAIVKRYTEDHKAYEFYLKGRYFWERRTEFGFQKGIEFFQLAIDKDPFYALAYTGIADCYTWFGSYSHLDPRDAYPKAKIAVEKALKIDDTLAEVHASIGVIKWGFDWDWTSAEKEYQKAIELNPNNTSNHLYYALCLPSFRRYDEAIKEINQALKLEPLTTVYNAASGLIFYMARMYDDAIEQLNKTLEIEPNFIIGLVFQLLVYNAKEMYEESKEVIRNIMSLSRGTQLAFGFCGYAHATIGQVNEAYKMLEGLDKLSQERYISPLYRAMVYIGLGNEDKSLENLEKAYNERVTWLAYLSVWHIWDPLRSDYRFKTLLKKMGLPED